MYSFTYTETDITEVLTKEEIQKQKEDYIRFIRMAEAIVNKERMLD
ncbi:hypothetical protein bcgnr5369_00290 [Bacillus cereus]|nr:hypothetical protein [Bacillus cereus]